MGGSGSSVDQIDAGYQKWIKGGMQASGPALLNPNLKSYQTRYAQEQKDQKELRKMAQPSLSDQAIRDAILSERNRALAGNSRKAAFAVRDTPKSFLGL